MLTSAIVWDPPIGIDLGFYVIRYYSLMYLIAFVLGWYIMKSIYKRDHVNLDKLDPLFIYTVLATLIGARLGHVIFYQPELFVNDPLSVFLPFQFQPHFAFTGFQGLASHGAAIGIVIAMYLYSKKILKKPLLWIMDRIGIPVAIGGMFIRFGNFMNSEIVGKPTHSNFGVIFTEYPAKVGIEFLNQMGITNPPVPRHPAQLYEAAGYLIIFFILWLMYWKTDKRKHRGYMFGLFLIMLFMVRFLVEFVKAPQVEDRASWILNTGQLLSIPFILFGIYLMYRARQKSKKESQHTQKTA